MIQPATSPRTSPHHHRRRAVALVTVISLLALLLILVTSLLSLSRAEMDRARTSSDSSRASQLADLATSIALAQLRTATTGAPRETGGFWAAQPGMVRRYADDGTYLAGYKLYSSRSMVHTGAEADLIDELPEPDWDAHPHRFVDLNAPAVRPSPGGPAHIHFPIADPRSAASLGVAPPIDGFSYIRTARPGGSPLAGVIAPDEAAPDDLRLPMPVEWLYLLEDGTAGTLDPSGRFQGPRPATAANPIVGRVAFWADDESAKININTASEPTYFATPTLNNGTYRSSRTFDWAWARSQPAAGEFQRYPGHPATTALSPVLLPGRSQVGPADKATLYAIMPKLEHAGTEAGTRNIVDPPTPYNTSRALAERLFASHDDFLFQIDRHNNPLSFTSGLAAPEVVERSRFFLTPWGRSPEITLNGTPRIAIWPVGHRPEQRTIFDNLIAFCSSLGRPETGGHRFHFTREIADSATHDINLPRNRLLIAYLEHLANTTAPGYAASFADKYPEDHRQILIQIVDYIRSTNLYDARLEDGHTLAGADTSYPRILTRLPATTRTYTEGRFNGATGYHGTGFGFFPGNGQVVPARDGTNQGFGRYYTLDEVAMQFIACADGTPNADNAYRDNSAIPDPWKGGFASRFNATTYYSNFPPNPPAGIYGPDPSHPGYQSVNWNYALDDRTPLPRNTTRVQSTLLLEFFSVAAGYQILRGDFGVRVRNLSSLTLNGQPLFPPSRDTVTLKSNWDIADMVHGGYRGGGDPDPRGLLSGRRAPAIGNQPADHGYGNTGLAAPDNDRWNYDLLSEFIDVPQDAPMSFRASAPIEIEILDNRAGPAAAPVQTIVVRFPDESLLPHPLMALNYGNGSSPDHKPACMFWSYYRDGFNARQDASDPIHTSGRLRGREAFHHPWNFLHHHGRDVICSMLPWHGDYRLIAASPRVEHDDGSPYTMAGGRWTFVPHPAYPSPSSRGQHNMNHRYNWITGFLQSGDANLRIFPGAWGGQFAQDFPAIPEAATAAHRYGDFDEAPGNIVGGAQINKPDEGNFYVGGIYDASTALTPYFDHDWMFAGMEDSFFSPNRIMPSPVMMGSLPTGVISGDPWRTLLFRPQSRTSYGSLHPGASAAHGGQDPPDHTILDWFYMPVVEPYALTEPGSTAGRVNLNYQMMPFAHIRRATGLHALLKDELIPKINAGGTGFQSPVDVDATLAQFDGLFAAGKIFKSATQICEIHLVPEVDTASGDPAAFQASSAPARSRMDALWDAFRGTGDNMRERPYAHIYPRVTTRSQTWTIHCRAQSITKARSTDPAVFDPDRDRVTSEFRGATTIERYLDASDPGLPDHAADPAAPSLDFFHRYRILSQQRFQP